MVLYTKSGLFLALAYYPISYHLEFSGNSRQIKKLKQIGRTRALSFFSFKYFFKYNTLKAVKVATQKQNKYSKF